MIESEKEVTIPRFVRNLPDCNRIMISCKQILTLYLPVYLTVNIRNFKSLSFQNLDADIYATYDICIYVQDLPDIIVSELDKVNLYMPLHGTIVLDQKKNPKLDIISQFIAGKQVEGSSSQDKQKVIFKRIRVSGLFDASLQPYMRLTPFQLVDLIFTVNLKTLTLSDGNIQKSKYIQIKFLFMDDRQKDQQKIQKKINFHSCAVLGQYDLAEKKLHAQYTKNSEYQRLGQLKKGIFSLSLCKNKKQNSKNTDIKTNMSEIDDQPKKLALMYTNLYKRLSQFEKEYQKKKQQQFLYKIIKQVFQQTVKKIKIQPRENFPKVGSYKQQPKLGTKKQSQNKIKGEQKDKNIEQYAHFHIPLYKFPFVSLVSIILPLFFLGIINLAIFRQDPGLGERIGNISALMIAFIAMIHVIRASIPRIPIVTVIQLLVYLETFTTIFCLIQSFINRHQETVGDLRQSFFFMISLVITIIVLALPCIMLIIHYVFLTRSYNQQVGSFPKNYKQYINEWKYNEYLYYFKQQARSGNFLVQIKPNQRDRDFATKQYTEFYEKFMTKISATILLINSRVIKHKNAE